jgi:hypothetical protein
MEQRIGRFGGTCNKEGSYSDREWDPLMPWLHPSVYRIARMLETVPGVWGTSYGRWESTSDILFLHNSQVHAKVFHAFCYAMLTRHKNELVSVLTGSEKEDMAVCFPNIQCYALSSGNGYLELPLTQISGVYKGPFNNHLCSCSIVFVVSKKTFINSYIVSF